MCCSSCMQTPNSLNPCAFAYILSTCMYVFIYVLSIIYPISVCVCIYICTKYHTSYQRVCRYVSVYESTYACIYIQKTHTLSILLLLPFMHRSSVPRCVGCTVFSLLSNALLYARNSHYFPTLFCMHAIVTTFQRFIVCTQ